MTALNVRMMIVFDCFCALNTNINDRMALDTKYEYQQCFKKFLDGKYRKKCKHGSF